MHPLSTELLLFVVSFLLNLSSIPPFRLHVVIAVIKPCHTMPCTHRETCNFVAQYNLPLLVAWHQMLHLRAKNTLKSHLAAEHVLISASGKQGLTNQNRDEEVQRKKLRWWTYWFECYLRNSEIASSPSERSQLQTVISSLSTVAPTIFFVVDAQVVKIKIKL